MNALKTIKVIKRRVNLTRTPPQLEAEFRAAHWAHNRLLDFEIEHQTVMDAAAPKLARVSRLIGNLNRRDRWAERVRGAAWRPSPKPRLREALDALRTELKAARDSSEEWAAAKAWPNDRIGAIKSPRRKPGETAEELAARGGRRRTRREQYRVDLYAHRRCYHGTWNGVVASVDQAVSTVIKARAKGLPAQLRRPRLRNGGRIRVPGSGFRITDSDARKPLAKRTRGLRNYRRRIESVSTVARSR